MEPRPAHAQSVLSIPAVAQRLGICVQTAYVAAARGDFPARRIGRRWVVPAAAFEAWLGSDPAAHGKEAHSVTWK